ncbi:MAG: hypothetical protein HY520_02535 [Candidatus Aenigmarchaeota archaeon]|nr:hypothetical protein [Candidatus Aenigmarchaeota archaeon]
MKPLPRGGMRQAALLLALPLLVVVSGCTIPGTAISIPLFGFGNTISLENDVVVITRLSALPSTVVGGQPVKLVATVKNQGSKAFTDEEAGSAISTSELPITVDLFDYCDGLFTRAAITTECPGEEPGKGKTTCDITNLLPEETVEVRWTLTPDEATRLITPCTLKVGASYPYQTASLTTVHFINSVEYNRRIAEGSFSPRSSTTSLGEGPVKAWWEVKDQQPIIAAPGDPGLIPVTLRVENKGIGFLQNRGQPSYEVDILNNNIFEAPFTAANQEEQCADDIKDKKITRLIQGRRELPCAIAQLADKDVGKESTRQLQVDIGYVYEFRKETKVTVEPRPLQE